MPDNEWTKKTIAPTREKPPSVDLRFSCPGLFRFAFIITYAVVGSLVYYGGIFLFHLDRANLKTGHEKGLFLTVFIAAAVIGGIAALVAFINTAKIQIQSERLSDFFIVMFQFIFVGLVTWFFIIGFAMSIYLGKTEAQAAVRDLGLVRSALYILLFGSLFGVITGLLFFLFLEKWLHILLSIILSTCTAIILAKWHLHEYGVIGYIPWVSGIIITALLLFFAPGLVYRDRQQRRVVSEGSYK